MTRPRALCLILAVASLLALLGAKGLGEDRRAAAGGAGLAISGLLPEFDPGETRYVSRCGRGAAPIEAAATGPVRVTVRGAAVDGTLPAARTAAPGADFAIAVSGRGRDRVYRVRCLPVDFPAWRFGSRRALAPGLFTVAFQPDKEARPWVIAFDHEGVPRWWSSPPTRALWAQVLTDGTIAWARSFGDGYGLDPRMGFEIRSPSGRLLRVVRTKGSITDGHEFLELAGGGALLGSYAPAGRVGLARFDGPERASAVFAEVQELSRDGRLLWRWNSRGRIGLGETGRWWRNVLANPRQSPSRATIVDPVHINSIEPRGGRELVISTRHTDAVYGIDRASGAIRWKLGGTPTRESLRVIGDPARKLFGGQHDARVSADGVLTVYDNGKDRPRRPRAAFYRLEPARGQATYLGQLNDSLIERSHCCGSARPLAAGGWLVSWGDNPLVSAFDPAGRLAFRLHLAASTFRAVPAPASVSTDELERGMEAMEGPAGAATRLSPVAAPRRGSGGRAPRADRSG